MYKNIDKYIDEKLNQLYNSKNHSIMRLDFIDNIGVTSSNLIRFIEHMESKGLIDIEPNKRFRCDLTKFGYEIVKSGGWLEHLKLKSKKEGLTKSENKEKEQLEVDNLKLQNENLKYAKSIREKEEKISELTLINLNLQNKQLKKVYTIFYFWFFSGNYNCKF